MWSIAIVLAAAAVSAYVVKAHRKRVETSWKQLAAAVPDEPDKALGPAPYRETEQESSALVPHSRKALELLPSTKARMRLQQGVAALVPPALAAVWAAFPFEALGPWSGLIGAVWGLGTSVALLRDDRRAMGAFALMLVPLTVASLWMATSPIHGPVALWSVVFSVVAYGASRFALDQKDAASKNEADRERMADPKYLIGSTQRRAAGIASNRGSSGDVTDATARDNSTAT